MLNRMNKVLYMVITSQETEYIDRLARPLSADLVIKSQETEYSERIYKKKMISNYHV